MMGKAKIRVAFLAFALLGLALTARAVDKQTALLIDKEIEKHIIEIIKIRRFLHMNPELSNREYQTGKLIASKLISWGLEVTTGIAKTGVTALLKGSEEGLTVALRADIDALPIQELADVPYKSLNPGVMHACGHDIHTSIALGVAFVLNNLKAQMKGNIKFIFQPAEEGPPPGEEGGAALMIKEGALDNPPVRAIFALHVWPQDLGQVFFSPGPILAAADRFQISIKGKSSHAARPYEGIDAITLAAQVIVSIQSIISRMVDPHDPAVINIGKIQGGTKANIVADEVHLEGTIRTLSEVNRKRIPKLIENIVRGITEAFGAQYSFNFLPGTPPVYNHPELAKLMLPTLTHLLGENNIKDIRPQLVAEDFAYYCQKIPGFYFFLGVKNPQQETMAPLHSPYFNPDERSISLGIKIMCHLLLDCLQHQTTLVENNSLF
ncbi:MAG: M20 family metallopeptidase [Candidatus Aminicenantales bacterium]